MEKELFKELLKLYFKEMKKYNFKNYVFIFEGNIIVELLSHHRSFEVKVKNNSYIFQFSKRWTHKKLFNLLMEEFN